MAVLRANKEKSAGRKEKQMQIQIEFAITIPDVRYYPR
jgi:hypothetical protein